MIFDFMPATLSSLIKRLGPPNADLIDIKLYTWQLFNGLYYLMKVSTFVPAARSKFVVFSVESAIATSSRRTC